MDSPRNTLIIIATCTILSINAVKTITESYNIGSVYVTRKEQIATQYLKVVKKKNELDYINSPFFAEKQLRESLNYYKKGEKLLVFTKPISIKDTKTTKEIETKNIWETWFTFIKEGITSPK